LKYRGARAVFLKIGNYSNSLCEGMQSFADLSEVRRFMKQIYWKKPVLWWPIFLLKHKHGSLAAFYYTRAAQALVRL
jgi:hypothetical protein